MKVTDQSVLSTHSINGVKQLQVITLINIVQIGRWINNSESIEAASQDSNPEWLKNVLSVCTQLRDPTLENVVMSLLSELCLPVLPSQQEVNALWEHYAVTHMQGRLLLGCGNLDCLNLSGACEASLKTMLCGKCRRVRYCGVER